LTDQNFKLRMHWNYKPRRYSGGYAQSL